MSGTLDERIRAQQTRDPVHNLVTKVNSKQPAYLIWRWIAELTEAIAWLEYLGLAHGDLRPGNLLLDGGNHLKVSDFDCATAYGEASDGLPPPYARVLGADGGEDRNTFGYVGPRTEQFAIGSLIYLMTRGFEPYDSEWLGKDHETKMVSLLRAMKFPPTSDSEVDKVIRNCWYGNYTSVQALNTTVMEICPGIRSRMAKVLDEHVFESAEQECKRLVEEGILDVTQPRRFWYQPPLRQTRIALT
ncbi:MAG: hypothetical protein Q9182_005481 [Xanthomendoza sp. 2 TL-2023]